MNGCNVVTLFNQEARARQACRFNFDGKAIPKGEYVYRLATENEMIIEKFIVRNNSFDFNLSENPNLRK